jgi:enterochelin esterase-like enzyme
MGPARRLLMASGPALLMAVCATGRSAPAEPHTFELNMPDAHSVYLAGEMTGWDQGKRPMRRDSDAKWRVTVDLAPGEWLYKFVVDGRWMADPASPDHDADGQGGEHSFLFVGDGDWNEAPDVPKGRVDTLMFDSEAWARKLKVNVYLPPGFAIGKHYPVLWLLHGGRMDADQWLKTGKINRYMDNLIGRGAIRPYVIVMPSVADAPFEGQNDRMITAELPHWLARTYGLETVPAESAVAGMSMGGLGAVYLSMHHPDLYGFGISLSGYFSNEFMASLDRSSKLPVRLRLLCGQDDELVDGNRQLVRSMQERHWDFEYREDPGAHTWQYWSNRTVEMLTAVDSFFRAEHATASEQ